MRSIDKGSEPRSLKEHRASRSAYYENYAGKEELREFLVREQRGLCCYCMGRISSDADSMKIEHWKSQTDYPDEQIAYGNLLAACPGGQGMPLHLQHCDTRKGNQPLKFNPANPKHRVEDLIVYAHNGRISSGDDEFKSQLDSVLGLNLPLLVNRRKAALTSIIQWRDQRKTMRRGSVSVDQLRRHQQRLLDLKSDTLDPSAPVQIWWLGQRIRRLQG